jgi:hypothetical protein
MTRAGSEEKEDEASVDVLAEVAFRAMTARRTLLATL